MSFNQVEYISKFNKNNYKMYQFRVKKINKELIEYLDKKENRNSYILSLINDDINKKVYSLKEIKRIIKPILNKYGISDIYLFGSYARGEAKYNSDIDIYCDKGNIKWEGKHKVGYLDQYASVDENLNIYEYLEGAFS